MADAELHLQFQGDTILAVLGMIRRYTPDELDVFLGIAGLPALPWDFLRQKSRNCLFLQRITVLGFTRISSDIQSRQSFEINDQYSRSLFLNLGFFALRLYTPSCCLSTKIRTNATRLNHTKKTKLKACMTANTSRVFMTGA